MGRSLLQEACTCLYKGLETTGPLTRDTIVYTFTQQIEIPSHRSKEEEERFRAPDPLRRNKRERSRKRYCTVHLQCTVYSIIQNTVITQQGESFPVIPVVHNQETVKLVSITKKFFWLSENCVLTCRNIKKCKLSEKLGS